MSIFKKFTAQDIALVPFNAHKQYDFTSASADANSIKHFNTRWTSESIDIYSSSSIETYGLPADNINTIKYYQIDHLFYKNFKKDIGNRFGNKQYLKQKRDLYECANVLSIPTGLYGFEIKPSTFFLESSNIKVIDDSNGNLLISGTNVDNYVTDARSNLFRLDPLKAFKRYDLNTFEGYHNGVFYLDGEKRVNRRQFYNTTDTGEFDDSYYYNPIKYENINFATSSFGAGHCKFGVMAFDSFNSARVVSPDNEVFNFNPDDDFTITFNLRLIPFATTITPNGDVAGPGIGEIIHDGIVFHVTGNHAYLVVSADPNTIADGYVQTHDILSTISSVNDANGNSNLTTGAESTEYQMLAVNAAGASYVNSDGVTGPFESANLGITASSFAGLNSLKASTVAFGEFFGHSLSSSVDATGTPTDIDVFPLIGGGETNTLNILSHSAQFSDAPLFDYVRNGGIPQGRKDTWIANYDEVNLISKNLGFTNDKVQAAENNNIYLAVNEDGAITNQNVFGLNTCLISNPMFEGGGGSSLSGSLIYTSNFLPETGSLNGSFNGAFTPSELDIVITRADNEVGIKTPADNLPASNLKTTHMPVPTSSPCPGNVIIIRKIDWTEVDFAKRYIITKSTTKTVVPSPTEGQAQILKTSKKGASQPKDVPAAPQFPFSIYHQSNSISFERSDGDVTTLISGSHPTKDLSKKFHTVICQKTGSLMRISVDGQIIAQGTDQTSKQTQNTANIYIGSKGNDSFSDNEFLNGEIFPITTSSFSRYFSGFLGNVNIYNRSLSTVEERNISESINGSPYIGNIFYQNGFAIITHPKYQNILSGSTGGGTIETLKFQGSHLIYENEYQCTIQEDEFNDTLNISARKIRSHDSDELANFATGSLFRPYITTVGLYNDNQELLVVGKLGQPLRASDETDTTIVLRWDT